jgi:hypothetical protein
LFSTVAVFLAGALIDHPAGDEAEIEEICAAARERSIAGDLANFIALDALEARLLARRGQFSEAEALARRAVESADGTDHFIMRARSRLGLAEVLCAAGRAHVAASPAVHAVSIHVAKEDVTGAAWVLEQLAALGIEVP